MKILKVICAFSALAITGSTLAEEHIVRQKDKSFSTTELEIKAGDTVSFANDDPYFHNIFSLSESQGFDLGSYPQGESRSKTFKSKGEVLIECAIHPEMQLTIKVR